MVRAPPLSCLAPLCAAPVVLRCAALGQSCVRPLRWLAADGVFPLAPARGSGAPQSSESKRICSPSPIVGWVMGRKRSCS